MPFTNDVIPAKAGIHFPGDPWRDSGQAHEPLQRIRRRAVDGRRGLDALAHHLLPRVAEAQHLLARADRDADPVRQVNGSWLVYAGNGSFSPKVFENARVRQLLSQKGNLVGLDLTDISMVSSSTVGQWIRHWKDAKQNEVDLFLFAPTPSVRDVLKETNLANLFRVVEQKEELSRA